MRSLDENKHVSITLLHINVYTFALKTTAPLVEGALCHFKIIPFNVHYTEKNSTMQL